MRISFLTFSKVDIRFIERKLVWGIYTAAEALPTTRRVKIIDKREFVVVALNTNDGTFVVHVAALAKPTTIPIYSSCQAKVTALTSEETGILAEYSDFSNVFSLDSAAKLPEHTKINDHPIDLLNNKQTLYGPIYSLGRVELEILKTYIEAGLVSNFIRPSKSPTGAPILFV